MIPGGYLLLARKILESDIMDKPPHYLKLWVWMLGRAFYRDGDQLKRGQFLTSVAEMQEAGGYKIGYRTRELTRDEVRSAYEAFTKTTMITTTKTTRGMIITICNYEVYQDVKNYEPHNERTTNAQRSPIPPHTIEKEGIKNKKKEYNDQFEEIWKRYPAKSGKEAARKYFLAEITSEAAWQEINRALDNYMTMLESEKDWRKPKDGQGWFNPKYWRDYITWTAPQAQIQRLPHEQREYDRMQILMEEDRNAGT